MGRMLAGLILALVAAPALAQTQRDYDWCVSPTASDDHVIAGCTTLIESARPTSGDPAIWSHNRGKAYLHKGLYDQSIADETRAIGLQPNYPQAYFDRGVDYSHKGLFDPAVADLS